MKRFRPRRRSTEQVWIVWDESEDAPELVLGVFGDQGSAKLLFDSLSAGNQQETVAYGQYAVGWTFRDGSTRYTS